MGLKKVGFETPEAEQPNVSGEAIPSVESGTTAAINRLKTTKDSKEKPVFKQRDYEREALGKTRCVQFEAALMSPAIAGMQFSNMKEYLVLVKEAADAGVTYSFQD